MAIAVFRYTQPLLFIDTLSLVTTFLTTTTHFLVHPTRLKPLLHRSKRQSFVPFSIVAQVCIIWSFPKGSCSIRFDIFTQVFLCLADISIRRSHFSCVSQFFSCIFGAMYPVCACYCMVLVLFLLLLEHASHGVTYPSI